MKNSAQHISFKLKYQNCGNNNQLYVFSTRVKMIVGRKYSWFLITWYDPVATDLTWKCVEKPIWIFFGREGKTTTEEIRPRRCGERQCNGSAGADDPWTASAGPKQGCFTYSSVFDMCIWWILVVGERKSNFCSVRLLRSQAESSSSARTGLQGSFSGRRSAKSLWPASFS